MDITLIDPALFSTIANPLENAINQFIDAKDQFLVDRLQGVKRYITEDYPAELERDRILVIHPKPPPPKPRPYTPAQLDREVESVLSGTRSAGYSQVQLDTILDELKARREAALEAEDYLQADRIEAAQTQMLRRAESYNVTKMAELKAEDLTQKLDEARRHLADLQTRWRNCLANFREQRDLEVRTMFEANAAAVAKLEERKTEPVPPKFAKFSPRLYDLRQRERALVSSKRYDDAAVLQAELNQLEAVEAEANRQDWCADVDSQMSKLATKLNHELDVRQVNLEKEEHAMQRQMNREIVSAKRTVEHLQKSIEACEMPSLETNDTGNQIPVSKLPSLNLATLTQVQERSPKTFRNRALLNMKVYTRLPPKNLRQTAR
jgi:hypothetical protein